MGKPQLADNQAFKDIKPVSRSRMTEVFLTGLKFIIGVALLPVVYAVTIGFCGQILRFDDRITEAMAWGILSFLGVYLFIGEPDAVYKRGQQIVETIFRFFAPLVKVAPFVLPIYTILIFTIYLLLKLFTNSGYYTGLFIFLIGFSFALHIVFCARTLRSRKEDSLKAGYLFGLSLVYVLNVLLLACFFSLAFADFSFLNFLTGSYQTTTFIYKVVFTQLFL